MVLEQFKITRSGDLSRVPRDYDVVAGALSVTRSNN